MRKIVSQKEMVGQIKNYKLSVIVAGVGTNMFLTGLKTWTIINCHPENGILPIEQIKNTKNIVNRLQADKDNREIIITVSPYVICTINNCIQAGLNTNPCGPEIPKIYPGDLCAFEIFTDGKIYNIVDEETGLISAEQIDNASEILDIEFDKLLEIEEGINKGE